MNNITNIKSGVINARAGVKNSGQANAQTASNSAHIGKRRVMRVSINGQSEFGDRSTEFVRNMHHAPPHVGELPANYYSLITIL
jgi:hypothetical protein